MNIPVRQKTWGGSRLLTILALITLMFSILSTFLISRLSLYWTFDRRERSAREFVENVVDSINQRTEYYKHHCGKDAIKKIEENINVITDSYKVSVIDFEWSYYEYDLTFDGKNKFRVDVIRWPHNKLEIIHFMPILPKVNH